MVWVSRKCGKAGFSNSVVLKMQCILQIRFFTKLLSCLSYYCTFPLKTKIFLKEKLYMWLNMLQTQLLCMSKLFLISSKNYRGFPLIQTVSEKFFHEFFPMEPHEIF